jgi:anti-anti-sigma factor
MEIQEERSGGVLVITPAGRLDTTTSGDLELRLLRLLAGPERRFVIDLGRTEYISSAGLRVLLMLVKRLPALGGELVLCGLRPAVRQVFELAGFDALFRLEATRGEALAHLSGPE